MGAPGDPRMLNPYAPSAHLAAAYPTQSEVRNRGLWQAFGFFLLPVSLGAMTAGLTVHWVTAAFGALTYPIGLFVLRAKTGLSWGWIAGLLVLLPAVFVGEAWIWIAIMLD
jgi:hypothetical protein